ncbi:9861_t:CDS:2 [Entrophospora sp. SA101]|nr:9861_t:CDS:2 [Entrophospora sp. SA101]
MASKNATCRSPLQRSTSSTPENEITMSSFVNESSSLINFLHLYQRICNAEGPTNHKNQKEIRSYYYFGEALKNRLDSILTENQIPLHSAQVILNREVRQQLSVDISDSMKSVLLEYLMFILFLQMQSQG